VVTFVIDGLCVGLLYEPGPVHWYVTPEEVDPPVKFNVWPVHKGLLLLAVTPVGGFGFVSVTDFGSEAQPFNVTTMFVYEPPAKPVSKIDPEALDVSVCDGCAVPLYVYVNTYDVLAAKPAISILPLAGAQDVGSVPVTVILGFGFTVTTRLSRSLSQKGLVFNCCET